MQAGLHAFQIGQYDHDGFLLTTRTCLQRDWLMVHTTSQKPLMSSLQLIKHLTFKNLASYIQDGRTATLQIFNFIYIFFQQI
jgi:hypothetical protein